MGMMPPYDPLTDPSLAWAIGRVIAITPDQPTWSRPAQVTVAVDEVLRGEVPSRLELVFGAPREAQQTYFYVDRSAGPPPWSAETAARRDAERARLDATPVDLPERGARIGLWLAVDPEGWTVPSLRMFGNTPFPMRSRWVEAAHLDALRARIAKR